MCNAANLRWTGIIPAVPIGRCTKINDNYSIPQSLLPVNSFDKGSYVSNLLYTCPVWNSSPTVLRQLGSLHSAIPWVFLLSNGLDEPTEVLSAPDHGNGSDNSSTTWKTAQPTATTIAKHDMVTTILITSWDFILIQSTYDVHHLIKYVYKSIIHIRIWFIFYRQLTCTVYIQITKFVYNCRFLRNH